MGVQLPADFNAAEYLYLLDPSCNVTTVEDAIAFYLGAGSNLPRSYSGVIPPSFDAAVYKAWAASAIPASNVRDRRTAILAYLSSPTGGETYSVPPGFNDTLYRTLYLDAAFKTPQATYLEYLNHWAPPGTEAAFNNPIFTASNVLTPWNLRDLHLVGDITVSPRLTVSGSIGCSNDLFVGGGLSVARGPLVDWGDAFVGGQLVVGGDIMGSNDAHFGGQLVVDGGFRAKGDAHVDGVIVGVHVGDGASLTGLDASAIATGTLNNARLPDSISIPGSLDAQAGGVRSSWVVNGTLTASNVRVLGDVETVNALTTLSSNLFITSFGSGPALRVEQDSVFYADQTVAEFYTGTDVALLIAHPSGFVGIGTGAPTAPLDVHGAARAVEFVGLGSNLTALNASAIDAGTLSAARLPASFGITTSLAIGSATPPSDPSLVLDVVGAVSVRGSLTVGGTLFHSQNGVVSPFVESQWTTVADGTTSNAIAYDYDANVGGVVRASEFTDLNGNPMFDKVVLQWIDFPDIALISRRDGTPLSPGDGGGLTCRFCRFGYQVCVEVRMTIGAGAQLGTLGTPGDGWSWILPEAVATTTIGAVIGTALMQNGGFANYTGAVYGNSPDGATASVFFFPAIADAAAPFEWSAGDALSMSLSYEAMGASLTAFTNAAFKQTSSKALGLGILPDAAQPPFSIVLKGNLGVATSAPTCALDVSGNVRAHAIAAGGPRALQIDCGTGTSGSSGAITCAFSFAFATPPIVTVTSTYAGSAHTFAVTATTVAGFEGVVVSVSGSGPDAVGVTCNWIAVG